MQQRCYKRGIICALVIAVLIVEFIVPWNFRSLSSQRSNDVEADGVLRKNVRDGKICEPVSSIVFAKTHKTGGSSILELVQNYVKKYRLQRNKFKQVNILAGPYFGGYPGPFQRRFAYAIPNDMSAKDIIIASSVHHASGHFRFNKDEILPMMGKETKYVTILRHPLRQVESAFNYYYAKYYKIAKENYKRVPGDIHFAQELACHPEPFLSITKKLGVSYPDYIRMANESLNTTVPWFYRSSNSQAFDLGLDPHKQDEEYVLQKAKELHSIFDLVMITEYFAESLILLKDTLCMTWEDLLGPRWNTGDYERHVYTAEEEHQVHAKNKQDFILYDYFNQSFWDKVDAYGRERMQNDKNFLQKNLEKNKDVLVSKKDVTKRKLEHLGVYSPRSKGKNYHVNQMTKWIRKRLGHALNKNTVVELAEYMFDNGGWCPHRHQRRLNGVNNSLHV